MTIHLSPHAIHGVGILTHINGYLATPQDGFLGVLPPGTKIKIVVEVANPNANHQCYTLAYQRYEIVRVSKPSNSNCPGVYSKNLTVTEKITGEGKFRTTSTQVAAWPANVIGLDIDGKTWNIGIASQNGRYFLVTEEYIPPIEFNNLLPVGMILSSSPLRGTATINTGNAIFNARLHWTKMPWRKQLGLRLLHQGEVIKFEESDIKILGGTSSFRYEVIHCTLA